MSKKNRTSRDKVARKTRRDLKVSESNKLKRLTAYVKKNPNDTQAANALAKLQSQGVNITSGRRSDGSGEKARFANHMADLKENISLLDRANAHPNSPVRIEMSKADMRELREKVISLHKATFTSFGSKVTKMLRHQPKAVRKNARLKDLWLAGAPLNPKSKGKK